MMCWVKWHILNTGGRVLLLPPSASVFKRYFVQEIPHPVFHIEEYDLCPGQEAEEDISGWDSEEEEDLYSRPEEERDRNMKKKGKTKSVEG